MASVYFFLRKDKTNKHGKCPLHIVYEHLGSKARIPTGQSISPRLFDKKREGNWVKNDEAVNSVLRKILTDINEVINVFRNNFNSCPTTNELRALYNEINTSLVLGFSEPTDSGQIPFQNYFYNLSNHFYGKRILYSKKRQD